jgi:hypothetical protein
MDSHVRGNDGGNESATAEFDMSANRDTPFDA